MTKEKRKEYDSQYRQIHKEEIKKKRHDHYLANRERILKRQCKYRQTHKEQIQKYYWMRREEAKERVKRWVKEHPERKRELNRKYMHKRDRNLGFNPLNECFKDSEAHHINTKDVIYIPKEMHRSVRHSLTTRQGMAKINTLAIRFYLKQLQEVIK